MDIFPELNGNHEYEYEQYSCENPFGKSTLLQPMSVHPIPDASRKDRTAGCLLRVGIAHETVWFE
jgi:hypothetical protein